MSRDEAIALLVSDTIERLLRQRQIFWLQKILENGFPGYSRWTDDELRIEIGARGLEAFDDTESPADADEAETGDSPFFDECQASLVYYRSVND